MSPETLALATAAFALGAVHTVLGPDHYLPFVALARARSWSLARAVAVALACGFAHIASSTALGVAAFAGGRVVADLQLFDGFRGSLAAWLLLGLGLAYAVWGVRKALRGRRHSHLHTHADGTVHSHSHDHHGAHLHAHPAKRSSAITWGLFIVFLLGPCEPLIPLFIYPAASGGSSMAVASVVAAYSVATLGTMALVVVLGLRFAGLVAGRLPADLGRWSHAAAGLTLAACAAAIHFGL